MQRLAERLAVGIPHRDIERGQRAVEQAARPHPVAAPGQLFPGGLGLEHAHADQVLAELARRGADRRHQIRAGVHDVADAFDPIGRRDPGEHVPVRVDGASAGGVRMLDRNPHHVDGDLRDFHGNLRARGSAR